MGFTASLEEWLNNHHAHELLGCYKHGGNPLPADKIGFSSPKEVHWMCPKCGLEWNKKPNKVTRKGARLKCPGCDNKVVAPRNNLGVRFPELKAQWDQKKNNDKPEDHRIIDKEKRHWKCPKRHRWEAAIRDRVKSAENIRINGGELCPFCSGEKISPTYNLAVLYPHISKE